MFSQYPTSRCPTAVSSWHVLMSSKKISMNNGGAFAISILLFMRESSTFEGPRVPGNRGPEVAFVYFKSLLTMHCKLYLTCSAERKLETKIA